jgi:hypothetical protein
MAIDYTQIVQGDAFGLVKVSTKKAVLLRTITGVETNAQGQCVVSFVDGGTLISDLTFAEIFQRYNKKVLSTYQAQAGIKAESEDTQL